MRLDSGGARFSDAGTPEQRLCHFSQREISPAKREDSTETVRHDLVHTHPTCGAFAPVRRGEGLVLREQVVDETIDPTNARREACSCDPETRTYWTGLSSTLTNA